MGLTRKLLLGITVTVGILLSLASLASLFYQENLWWWLKILSFPRFQILIAAFILLPVFLLLKQKWKRWHSAYLLALAIAIAIQTYYIYPYTPLQQKSVPDVTRASVGSSSTLDIIVVNVLQTNRQPEELINIINTRDPDIILAMETNSWWEEALEPVDRKYPYGIEYPLSNSYGMILYSKYKLEDPEIKFLNYDSVPSFHTKIILKNKERIYFHGVHPPPPVPGGPENKSEKKIALQKVGNIVKANNLPAIVAGDLNDVAWADASRLFGARGLLNDIREGRKIMPTYNARSLFLRWPLDYIYVTKHFRVVEFTRLDKFGSDHFPVYSELAIIPVQIN